MKIVCIWGPRRILSRLSRAVQLATQGHRHTRRLGQLAVTSIIFGVILLTSVNGCHDNNNTLRSIFASQTPTGAAKNLKKS